MRIVLTGGPGSGKTVVATALAAELGCTLVTESATEIYTARRVNWRDVDTAGRRELQRAMYRRQLAAEGAVSGGPTLLDRGTIDGAAYWPDGHADFFVSMDTTHAAELARYDAVLLLESAAAVGAYDGAASNAARFEDAAAALRSGEVLRELWGGHPNLIDVPATPTVAAKHAAVAGHVRRLLSSPCP